MNVLPRNLPILHDDGNGGDAMHVSIARADMLLMGRRWAEGRPIDISALPERRTNGVYRVLAGVRIDHMVVTLERHDEDGRMLCITPERGVHYRLVLPPEIHPMADHPDPCVELNASMRFWGRVPDMMHAWNPASGKDRWSIAAGRIVELLGATASSGTADHADREATVVMPSPWAPAGAACYGDLRAILLWRDDVLAIIEDRAEASACASLDVFYRHEGVDTENGSASIPTPRLLLRSASFKAPLATPEAVTRLRLLSDLGAGHDGAMTASFDARSVGCDPRFVEPVIVGSWRSPTIP